MMFNLDSIVSDPYNRKARLQPALLVLLPVFLIALLTLPEIKTIWSAPIGLLIYCGGAMWLTQAARDRGKLLEPELFKFWGGKPSIALLRHNDSRLTKATKSRYRNFLERRIPDLKFASIEDEQKSQMEADDAYESATLWLLTKTRDREHFRLLFDENVSYGFRRNLWALKSVAVVIDALIITFFAIYTFYPFKSEILTIIQQIDKKIYFGILFTIAHLLAFIFIINRRWVRLPAEAYALQLLAACDQLSDNQITKDVA